MRRRSKTVKGASLEMLDSWDEYWKDSIEFYDFINEYIEVDDDLHGHISRKRKHAITA